MAFTRHYFTKLEAGKFYHVFNRAVDRKPMFKEIRNYDFFLEKLVKYIIPYADVYAFCLLGNHFHLLVKIKGVQNDLATLQELPTVELPTVGLPTVGLPTVELPTVGLPTLGLPTVESPTVELPTVGLPAVELPTVELPTVKLPNQIVSNAFRKMFQSYAMAFNKQENRIGALFQEPFKRSLIDSDEYLIRMIYYIHLNPQKHGLVDDFRNYPYSSFRYYEKRTPCNWVQKELFDLFGGYDGFMTFHNNINDDPDQKYIIE